jgi:hypothetical protein
MRHWLTLLLLLLLLPGCAYFKQQPGAEDKNLKKTETKNLAPGWNPAYDRGASYDRIEGRHTVRDMSEFHAQPGKTFLVKVRDWVVGPEAIVPTASGVVYLEQQAVRAIELEGYEHALSGKADYSMEIHVLCAAPACRSRAARTRPRPRPWPCPTPSTPVSPSPGPRTTIPGPSPRG